MDLLLAIRLLEGHHQLYKPWNSNWTDTIPSLTDFVSDISEWLMFSLFAVFSVTYFKEFRDLGIEMSCFSKDSGRQRGTSIKNYSPMLIQRESAGSDQDWTLHFNTDFRTFLKPYSDRIFLIFHDRLGGGGGDPGGIFPPPGKQYIYSIHILYWKWYVGI